MSTADGPPSTRPLAGTTIVDLSRVLAGPYATQLLADLGADVWKIERTGSGDETRGWGPPFIDDQSAYFLSVNRNKRSVEIDFADATDRRLLERAIAEADAVFENFLPGQLDRFGLGPAELRARHPNLVVCSITGYGQSGPYAELSGYDAVLQGFTGLMSITGEASGPPSKVGVAAVDVLTGAHAAAAALASLLAVARGGTGAHVDIALYEVGVASLVNVAQAALSTGRPARRHGNAHPQIVPYQTFEAADGPLVVAVGNDGQWRRLCQVLELPELADDERFRGNADRVLHRQELIPVLAGRVAGRPRSAWLDALHRARVPAGAVRDVAEAVGDPAFRERGMVADPADPGGTPLLRLPWLLDASRPTVRLRPPRLGEHNEAFRDRFGS